VQITVAPPHELGRDEIAAWRSRQHQTDYLASPFLSPEFTLAVGAFRPGARVNNCQGLSLVEGQRPFKPYAATMTPSPVIDLADGFDAYQEKLRVKSPRFCRDLTRKALRLEQEAGELRFVPNSRDPEALRGLIDWKSDQFLRNGTVNIFGRSWIVGLLDRLLSTRGDHLSVLLSVLYADKLLQHYGRVALGNSGVPRPCLSLLLRVFTQLLSVAKCEGAMFGWPRSWSSTTNRLIGSCSGGPSSGLGMRFPMPVTEPPRCERWPSRDPIWW
jgi:hypothetical protein